MLPMQRFLSPAYDDGIQSIRRSVLGPPLPSARLISTLFHTDQNQEINSVTLMFMQWGQFVDHDVTSTVKARAFNGSIPRCCDGGGKGLLPPEFLHPSCLPITVPHTDPFLAPFDIRCMEFLRSAPSTSINCQLGHREQINQVTPYLDASAIYGSDLATTDSVRTFSNGIIFYGRPAGDDLNPPDPPGGEICKMGALSEECLQSGDGRISENPGLVAVHSVFVRYHNKIAGVLARVNGHWSDERIFQETRRIVGAVVQHITFREYLPLVLGPEVMDLFELRLLKKGYYEKYNPKINPAIANAFSAAAFRFGHSLVQNSFVRFDKHHRPLFNNVSLHNEFTNFDNTWTFGSLDRFLLGMSNQPSQKRDEFITQELTQHLFQFSSPFGMDLAAINIQRGRDHGIPSYTTWRKPCGLSPITSWRDLEQVMSFTAVDKLRLLYLHVDDVDLFPAGLAERPLKGGIVGPTFACIIAQQFANLRKGDQFWYENEGFESSFSPAQLQQIRRVSLAQMLCQTLDEIETMQPFVFLTADNDRNERVSCSELRSFDLGPWTESFDDNFIDRRSDRKVKIKPTTMKAIKTRQSTTTKPQQVMFKYGTNTKTKTHQVTFKYGTNTNTVTSKPYNVQNQDDVTYLVGLVPETSSKTPPIVQVNINIHYPSTTTTDSLIDRTKRPNFDSYDNGVVVITKRPSYTDYENKRKPNTPRPLTYAIYEDRPFATSQYRPYDVTDYRRRPYEISTNNDNDNDDILNAFLYKKKEHKTDSIIDVNDKLDFDSHIVYRHNIDKKARDDDVTLDMIRKVNLNVNPSEDRWKYYRALDFEPPVDQPILVSTGHYSFETPRPIVL